MFRRAKSRAVRPRGAVRMATLALLVTGCGGGLQVRAGQPRAGTQTAVDCRIEGHETPTRPYLRVAVGSPCTTDAPTRVTVLAGSQVLSSTDAPTGLEARQTNYLVSKAFADPGKGALITVEVQAKCQSGKEQHGSDQCQMP